MLRRWDMKPTSVEGGEEHWLNSQPLEPAAEPYALILTDMHMPMWMASAWWSEFGSVRSYRRPRL